MQTEVVLSLGGNKGDREMLLSKAIEAIKIHFQLVRVSEVYETSAWGGVAKGNFLNQVVVVLTEKQPEEVLGIIQGIESQLGRKRDEHWGDRTMDIDILYFGERKINTSLLQIPHPYIAQREFVLVPLAAILPQKVNPVTGKNSLEMLAEGEDLSEVKVFKR
ncbi:2-amino-4-hydroxy-6-hydroxymethyldihydropteridine diphosphokinase [Algoriphagus jejuensis]|uniref:2-amino-4-hydroxy-6-hydroxymethyldihydropteridine pyrophosphokinase n=1 Tax=Algoriphagus jejuensis TaxID=419934 RepID=A0ABN1N3U6_9BACT